MRLKRLELFGFKSFADRSVLNFQHDLIGIVGPNGCGKSNVVDAVRWILGEQRPSSMRGGEMIDVIFKGSASRPAMSVAEGTIVFDNTGGTLAERGAEIAVTRRVYKSGEGEYLIDGARVRLKDVREMLFGTGLGSRGYSVLEQGKIDAILSANPLERRTIFEEAAGISRYRQRKKETESRLGRVQADLLRLEDVLGELEKRERSLKIQAGRARRFVEARDAWRVDGVRLARHQLSRLAEETARTGRALAAEEREVEAQRSRRGAAEEDVIAREQELSALSSEIARLSSESAELGAEIRATDERRTQLASRLEAWRASSEDESKRAAALDERHAQRMEEAETLGRELREIEGLQHEAQQRVLLLARETAELTEEHQRIARAAERKSVEVLGFLQDLTSTRNRVQHLEDSLEPLTERELRAEDRLRSSRAEVASTREQERAAAKALQAAEESLASSERSREQCLREGGEIESRLAQLDGRRIELELEVARLSSRIESLRDWERERQGLETGAQELLGALERGEGPRLSRELAGLLADHLSADTRIARALDAALGRRAQALVCASPDDAASVLAWLKERRGGRVSLVAPPDVDWAADRDATEVPPSLRTAEGVEGVLAELANPREGFHALARALLGDVVLVRDAVTALALARSWPRLRFVTPDGDLFDAAGAEGGHLEVSQGAVGRRSTADELEVERDGRLADCEQVLAALSRERSLRAGQTGRLAELDAALRAGSTERSRAASALDSLRARLAELVRAAELSQRECDGLANERDGVAEELDDARTLRIELEGTYAAEKEQLGELEEQRRALEAERGQRMRDEGQARIETTGFTERLGSLRRRCEDLERTCGELRTEIERAARLAQEHRACAERAAVELVELAQKRDDMLAQRGEIEERLVDLRHADARGREAIEVLRRRGEAITGELEALLDRVSQARLEKQRLELSRDEIARRAQEDFERPAHELLEGFTPEVELAESEALAALERRVLELKESMEKLGPVNLEAVAELEEVSERLGFLSTQKRDLDEARRSLEGTIKKLNEESERRFVEAFEAIRAEFKVLFRQLFGGGRADVLLMEGESVLDAGIEIIARPPGREALPISLLSGGQRTLTALALLFAVFRTNSSPFCILDEVDAALDEANIGRFLSMVESSLGETQYIIVTHNKGTMAACKVLYGVTMAVKGVSHVVSVELEDVDEFVPEAVGNGSAEVEVEPAPEDLRDVELVPRRAEPQIAG